VAKPRAQEAGQTTVEYLLVIMIAVTVLFPLARRAVRYLDDQLEFFSSRADPAGTDNFYTFRF
jgi:hypothetical protein